MTCFREAAAVTRQEYAEKLERGLAQVRAGQGITKTMEELELEVKDRQIEQQAQTITRLSDALVAAQQTAAAAQALHAGMMHQQLLSSEVGFTPQEPVPGRKRSWISRLFGS